MKFNKWYEKKFDYLKGLFIKDNLDTIHTSEDEQEIENNQQFQDYVDLQFELKKY